MKRINKILGLGIGIVAAFGLASCTNETTVVDPENPGNDVEEVTLNLVKAPDFYAWSGSQVIGDTRGTRGTYVKDGKTYYKHDEEVEVNLSILDQKTWGTENPTITDLAAKLSIHVRQAIENLTVKLEIPAKYIIDSDDLTIFNSHLEDIKPICNEHTVNYVIGGSTVTAEVSFGDDNTDIEDGGEEGEKVNLTGPLTVTLTGINQKVIDDCWTANQDGINLEIYIYIDTKNSEINGTITELKGYLDNSKIYFNDNALPKYYINAFGLKYIDGKKTSEINPNDCTVTPPEGWTQVKVETEDGEIQEFPHLNGSPYNKIYMLKIEGEDGSLVNPTPDHAHGGAVEIPDQGKDDGNDQNQGTETGANGGGDD